MNRKEIHSSIQTLFPLHLIIHNFSAYFIICVNLELFFLNLLSVLAASAYALEYQSKSYPSAALLLTKFTGYTERKLYQTTIAVIFTVHNIKSKLGREKTTHNSFKALKNKTKVYSENRKAQCIVLGNSSYLRNLLSAGPSTESHASDMPAETFNSFTFIFRHWYVGLAFPRQETVSCIPPRS